MRAIVLASLALGACATSPPATTGAPAAANQAQETPAPTTTAAAPASPGGSAIAWVDYAIAPPGAFHISLPQTWQAIDPSQLADAAALDALKRQNPVMAPTIQQSVEQMRSGNIAFLGVDPSSASPAEPYPDSLAVARPDVGVGPDRWNEFVARNIDAVRQQLGLQQGPTTASVSLPAADDAVEAIYSYALTTLDGRRITIVAQQYLVRAGDRAFVLTLTTTGERAAVRRDLFREIANRFAPQR
ncbi:MAG: hypothetical protein M3301_08150 [Chloroflexota bacterium]|nr:hypothetical protein [Chloroflexota bacterium]